MTIKFTFTDEDFIGVMSMLKVLGKIDAEEVEEVKGYWQQLADKEFDGDELLKGNEDAAGLKMALLLSSFNSIKEE